MSISLQMRRPRFEPARRGPARDRGASWTCGGQGRPLYMPLRQLMPHGYSNRVHALLLVLFLVVAGSAIVGLALRGSSGDSATCPRTFPPTDLTAMLLLENTSGLAGLS